ncbi:MAG: septum formation protein Maf [Bacteroidetes bacterium 4572_77]|nr:MAG: septum formation protein Maf [Bacteroidetes bacterium 4572_77]
MNDFLKKLQEYDIVLASRSSRRHALLRQLDVKFRVAALDVKESFPANLNVSQVAEYISAQKLKAFPANRLTERTLLITADTIVAINNIILGKPKTAQEAQDMLEMLSGQEHKVITGVSMKLNHKEVSFSSTTRVKFKELTKEEIQYYVEEYQPFDKAGAYGIQEWIGKIAVEWIEGSFYNVMGLPIQNLYTEMIKIID